MRASKYDAEPRRVPRLVVAAMNRFIDGGVDALRCKRFLYEESTRNEVMKNSGGFLID